MKNLQRWYYTRGGLVHTRSCDSQIAWAKFDDVAELEARHAAVCAHMMRMFYALVNFTNPHADHDAAEVMAKAKQAVELYLNDSSMVVTVELPDDENEVAP
ncbi:hypothetical protein UFOVP422_38 [uncultured Caudovirales phage]|uniref:Uncharacterized protein n=1 Tax=uncultured Caudovirales phage TaxID=2100421 RepID=A0A6J5MDR2_9CAUD|nr:hypothetical protein UFOVP422_38 [uncultured Caudovirales phage]